MSNIKIYVSCHDNFFVPECECLYPIQVGCALTNKKIKGFAYDDEGENISYKNKSYCELTALYWMWKNVEADYYGLFHYRRYLSFDLDHIKNNGYYKEYKYIDSSVTEQLKLNKENIEKIVSNYDIVAPIANYVGGNFENNYEQYCKSNYLHKEDMDTFLKILIEKYPYLKNSVEGYMKSRYSYFCNIGIMKKEFFEKYCEILFDILEETEKRSNLLNYSAEELRVFGHLSERLFGIMIFYWKSLKNIRIQELRMVKFENCYGTTLQRIFEKKENTITIAMASNNYYSYYLGVTIQSIICNSDKKYNYDIIILDGGILESNKSIILSQIKGLDNFSIRFFDTKILTSTKSLKTKKHMTIETWYRLYLPYILKEYDKVIYLDCDLVVNDSLAELYTTEIEGHLVGATRDLPIVGMYCENRFVDYLEKKLLLDKPYDYFQAGVLLLNLKMFRNKYSLDELLDFATSDDWEWLDQDVMNMLGNKTLKILKQDWNVEVNRKNIRIKQIKSCPAHMYFEYMESRKEPKIIHYSGEQKPWATPEMDMADYFWDYARKSKFYELILYRVMNAKLEPVKKEIKNMKIGDKAEVQSGNIVDIILKDKRNIFTRLFPMNSKRRLLLRRIYHLFRKDVYPTQGKVWSIEADIHMHNEIAKNYVKKYTGLWIFDSYMRRMRKVKNRHLGERCFIICTGPSLEIRDIEKISKEFTIGVNSIVTIYDKTDWRPSYYCLVDIYAFGEYLKKTSIPGDRLSQNEAFVHYRTKLLNPIGNELYVPINSINHSDEYLNINRMKLSSDPAVCIYDCFTVTNMAIQMAIYMGFKEIYLLGADCNYKKEKLHFIEIPEIDNKQRNAKYLPHAVEMSIKGYEHAKEFAEERGVKIYNATRGGNLEVFERVDIDKIIVK